MGVGEKTTMPSCGNTMRVHPCSQPLRSTTAGTEPLGTANAKLPLHSPYMIPTITKQCTASGNPVYADAKFKPTLTRPIMMHDPQVDLDPDTQRPVLHLGTDHLVTYAPTTKLWIDMCSTETRAWVPRLLDQDIVGTNYRVFTNLKQPRPISVPLEDPAAPPADPPVDPRKQHNGSMSHTHGTKHNAPITSHSTRNFKRWHTLRDPIHGHDLEGLKHMLDSGAWDVNERGSDGYCPLHVAIRFGGSPYVEALLGAGADVNTVTMDGDTPMHMVAKNGSAQISQLLIAGGPDLELQNKRGWTAEKLATFNGHKAVVAAIIGCAPSVPHRGLGKFPQGALGQQHPLADGAVAPATINFPGCGQCDHEDDSGHNHDHDDEEGEGAEAKEKPSKLDSICVMSVAPCRAAAAAHCAIPEQTRTQNHAATAAELHAARVTASQHDCHVLNYAQPMQYYKAEQKKLEEQKKNSFWFKYSI